MPANPPAACTAIGARMANPMIMISPWKRSVQATANIPPRTVYRITMPPKTNSPIQYGIPIRTSKTLPAAFNWAAIIGMKAMSMMIVAVRLAAWL